MDSSTRSAALRKQALIFGIFLLSGVNIHLLGYIRVSEIILLALLPVLLVRSGLPRLSDFEKWLFALLSTYIVAQAGLDIYYGTPFEDSAKRVGSISILLLLLLVARKLLMRDFEARSGRTRERPRWREKRGLHLAARQVTTHAAGVEQAEERRHSERQRRSDGRDRIGRRGGAEARAHALGRLPYVLLAAHAGWYFSYFLALLIGAPLDGLVTGHPNKAFAEVPWDLGLGMAVTGLVLIGGAVGGSSVATLCLLSLLPLGWFHLYMGARSLGAITLAVLLVGCGRAVLGSQRPYRFNLKTAGAGVVACALAGLAAPPLLIAAAGSGLLPERFSSTTEGQAADPDGLVVAARRDVFFGFKMVQRRPILGFGSSQMEPEYRDACADELADYQYQVCGIGSIPSHSHLVGAWIEAGILGAAFWMFVLGASFYVLCRVALWTSPMTDLVVFQMLLLSWDVVFSPGPVRVDMALKLSLLVVCVRMLASADRHRFSTGPRRSHLTARAAVHRA